jgi:RNA polymerase sigma-70 factor (ECF subfamily)
MLGLNAIGLWSLLTALAVSVSSRDVDWRHEVERLGAGDVQALAKIRRLITGQLIRLGAYASRDSWDDVAQDVIVRVWRSHRDGKIRDYRAFAGFVRTMTRNVVIDAARKRREDLSSEAVEATPDPLSAGGELGVGDLMALRDALSRLSDRHREVVETIYLGGMSYEEAAEALQKPRGTVNRLQREAMQQLREVLLPSKVSRGGAI